MYSNEKNAQIIVSLLKEHKVKYVVASPGTTNYGIVGSIQDDSDFIVLSAVDERSAAYMACGIAETLGEPVVISCTGATASRNYLSALTEAYYRKLPIIAITSFNGNTNLGQMVPQNLDRTVIQRDVALLSVQVPKVKDAEDASYCNRIVNEAILACRRHGGGPVHINVCCDYSAGGFEVSTLDKQRLIERISRGNELPSLDSFKKIAVFIGAHQPFDNETRVALDHFLETRNAVALCDHTSNYHGPRVVLSALASENTSRWSTRFPELRPDLIIDIGEISGDYVTTGFLSASGAPVWRVSEDGEVRDRFGNLRKVFEMEERTFFGGFATELRISGDSYVAAWRHRDHEIREKIPRDLPFTNRWVASVLSKNIPDGSILHLAILNSLRSWNYFPIADSVSCFCNTGGFGIDGCLSAAVGSAIASPGNLVFEITGDLAFFYDMNCLGNRHLGDNLRILLVNNGVGAEFHMPYSPASVMGSEVDGFVAAAGHFRGKDKDGTSPAEAWSRAVGLSYRRAATREELLEAVTWFVSREGGSKILECLVDVSDEELAAATFGALDRENASRKRVVDAAQRMLPKGLVTSIKKKIT